MIKSMTGFGRSEYSDGKRNIICEIRSVNHRYSDITVKMPRRYSFAEDRIKQTVKEKLVRGKVDVVGAGLLAYIHGHYYGIRRKPLGRFGFSVMKAKTRKRINKEAHEKRVEKNRKKRNK